MALQIIGLTAAIYIVSQLNVRYLLRFFMLLVKDNRIVVWLLSVLFLPGTLVHELSHLLCAELLLVPTSDLHIIPEILPDRTVKLGSVQMAQTDRIRRFIIGIAPLILGVLAIWLAAFFSAVFVKASYLTVGIYGYVLWQVSHSMFSSRKDLEGAIWGILGIGLVVLLIQFLSQIIEIPAVTRLIADVGAIIALYVPYLRKGLLDALLLDIALLASTWIVVRIVEVRKYR